MSKSRFAQVILVTIVIMFGIIGGFVLMASAAKHPGLAAAKDSWISKFADDTSESSGQLPLLEATHDAILANADIVKLSDAHLSDDVIISAISLQRGSFNTMPDDLIALKKAGVSDKVVMAILKSDDRAQLLSSPR